MEEYPKCLLVPSEAHLVYRIRLLYDKLLRQLLQPQQLRQLQGLVVPAPMDPQLQPHHHFYPLVFTQPLPPVYKPIWLFPPVENLELHLEPLLHSKVC